MWSFSLRYFFYVIFFDALERMSHYFCHQALTAGFVGGSGHLFGFQPGPECVSPSRWFCSSLLEAAKCGGKLHGPSAMKGVGRLGEESGREEPGKVCLRKDGHSRSHLEEKRLNDLKALPAGVDSLPAGSPGDLGRGRTGVFIYNCCPGCWMRVWGRFIRK